MCYKTWASKTKNLEKMLRKSSASNAWAVIFFSKVFLLFTTVKPVS